MTLRTFDYDDFPIDGDHFLHLSDRLKKEYPKFCASVFAIPKIMRPRHWRALHRRDWLRVCPHGFTHRKRECRFPEIWQPRLGMLDDIASDDCWTKCFKGPWYGYSEGFVEELRQRKFSVCNKSLYGFPLPMPGDLMAWNIANVLASHYSDVQFGIDYNDEEGIRDDGLHVVSHPVYPPGSLAKRKAGQSEISNRHVEMWTRSWSPDDEWAFVSDLTQPALLKLNLGCGPDVRDDWTCLDPRAKDLDPRVIEWDFRRMIPF